MEFITDIKFNWFNSKDKNPKAFGTVELGGAWLCNFAILKGKNNLFVSWVKEKGSDGKWYTKSGPKDLEIDKEAQKYVLNKYNLELQSVNGVSTKEKSEEPNGLGDEDLPF